MKVLLTALNCNPPFTRKIVCDTLRYFDTKHELRMYDTKGKVIARAITDDWHIISYVDKKGQEHFIKGKTTKVQLSTTYGILRKEH